MITEVDIQPSRPYKRHVSEDYGVTSSLGGSRAAGVCYTPAATG